LAQALQRRLPGGGSVAFDSWGQAHFLAHPQHMSCIEPNRRRLSVGRETGGQEDVGHAKAAERTAEGKLEKAGLAEIFERARLNGSRAISVTSISDGDGKRRASFQEKSEEVLVPAGGDPAELRRWLEELGIGWSCRKGLKPEAPNQDSFSVLIVENDFALYCVYDGHGPFGHDVSDLARESIVSFFLHHPLRDENAKVAFEECFLRTQRLLETTQGVDPAMSGTTCTMVYHKIQRDMLWVAHVGDSRAVLCKRGNGVKDSEDLTVDHKPNLHQERERIENANPPGRVVFDGFYNHRVFAMSGMYPGLNMSRALGDVIGHKEAGLTAMPDVKEVDLAKQRLDGSALTLVLCTDGVWEFVGSEEALGLITNYDASQARAAMEELAQISWDRWMDDSDNEISDDITGILAQLSKPHPH